MAAARFRRGIPCLRLLCGTVLAGHLQRRTAAIQAARFGRVPQFHGEELLVLVWASHVDFAGEEFFACSGFTDKQNVRIRRGDFANRVQSFLKDSAAADDLIETSTAVEVFAELLIFQVEILEFEKSLQAVHQFIKDDGLHEVIECSSRERIDRHFRP